MCRIHLIPLSEALILLKCEVEEYLLAPPQTNPIFALAALFSGLTHFERRRSLVHEAEITIRIVAHDRTRRFWNVLAFPRFMWCSKAVTNNLTPKRASRANSWRYRWFAT